MTPSANDLPSLALIVADALGTGVRRMRLVKRRYVGLVVQVWLNDGSKAIVKTGEASILHIEARMLRSLSALSPVHVPDVYFCANGVMVLEFIVNDRRWTARSDAALGAAIAALHQITAPAYGFNYDTLIGTLGQENEPSASWIPFFRDRRLLPMAHAAHAHNRLSTATLCRVERLAAQIDRWLDEPARPSLIHGDLWSNNVLVCDEGISGLVDPAVYFADPEIEIAFASRFGGFSTHFINAYRECLPATPGALGMKRQVYSLFHLLMHQRLFDMPAYLRDIDTTLDRIGV